MRNFFSFLAGIVISALVILGVAGWMLFKPNSGTTPEPVKLEVPIGRGIGKSAEPGETTRQGTKGPVVSSTFRIEVGPHVAAAIAKEKTWSVAITIREFVAGEPGGVVAFVGYENPQFPLVRTLDWMPQYFEAVKRDSVPPMTLSAQVCIGVTANYCDRTTAISYSGITRTESVNLAAAPEKLNISPPMVLVSRKYERPSVVDCLKVGRKVQTRVQATPQFLAVAGQPERMVFVAMPVGMFFLGAPFTGPKAGKVGKADMEEARRRGLYYQAFSPSAKDGTPISFTVPEGKEQMVLNYFAVGCTKEEDDATCAAKVFPMSTKLQMMIKERMRYVLVAKDFLSPYCGSRPIGLFLHEWPAASAQANAAAMKAAPIPELTEGLVY